MTVQDDFSTAEWLAAQPMGLRSSTLSVEATGLVEGILEVLPFPPGKLLKPSTVEKRRTALRALMADLLKLETAGVPGYHGMAPKDFPARVLGFSYDVFRLVKDAMVAAGLLRFGPGHQRLMSITDITTGAAGPIIQHGGYQARFRLTSKALEEVERAGVRLDAWKAHWSPPEPLQSKADRPQTSKPPIELRASKDRRGGMRRKGENLPVDVTAPAVQAILADLQEHNAFLESVGVSGVDFVGLRRIFNNGDEPGYAWNKGGRFYSLRVEGMGKAYETLKGDKRRSRIKLGGETVGEVDMSASQLRLLYALLGEKLPADLTDDLYALPGTDRAAVKLIVTQAIGKEGMGSKKWGREAILEYAKGGQKASLEADHPFAVVMGAVLEKHPILRRLGGPGCPSALELQYAESEVMRRAMALLRIDGVPSLPVHDSLLVPLSSLDQAEDALRQAFKLQVELVSGQPSTIHPRMNRKGLLGA